MKFVLHTQSPNIGLHVGKRVNKYFKHRKTLMLKRCRLRKKLDSSNCDDQNCGYEQKIRDI